MTALSTGRLITCRRDDVLFVSYAGAHIGQRCHYMNPGLIAVANKGSVTQYRTGGGSQSARQDGLELLDLLDFPHAAAGLAEEAVALLSADE